METYPPYLAYLIVLLGSTIISGLLLVRVWSLRKTPGAYGLMLAFISVAIWSTAYILEISRINLAEKILWAKVEYIGISFVSYGAFVFVLNFTGSSTWLTRLRAALISVPAFVCILLVWTNDLHYWIWSEINFTNNTPFGPLSLTHGTAFFLVVLYEYVLIIFTTLALLRIILNENSFYKAQARIMLWGMAFPWAANIIYISGWNPFDSLDLTPIALTLTNIAMSISFLRYRFMDLQPIARDSIFNVIEDGVVVLDYKDRVVDINPVGILLFQDKGNTIGSDILSLLPDWKQWLAENPDGEILRELNFTLGGEKKLYFSLRTTSIFDTNRKRKGRVILISNITSRKQAEFQTEETNQMKTRLLANIGHDLRSPLGAIIGYAELLRQGAFGDLNDEQKKASAEILDSANQLSTFINNVIGRAQIESGRIILREAPFHVSDIAGPLLSTLNFHAGKKGLSLNQFTDPSLPKEINGDLFWVRQIVLNLVHNSVKFTEQGSINLRFLKWSDRQWAIQVQDTGIGIPLEAQKRIFQAFEQAGNIEPDKNVGFGLGLSIVAQLTSIMRGNIELESREGKGCTFTIILPLPPPATKPTN